MEKKPTKKRKSWGQELPIPKTNLPPRYVCSPTIHNPSWLILSIENEQRQMTRRSNGASNVSYGTGRQRNHPGNENDRRLRSWKAKSVPSSNRTGYSRNVCQLQSTKNSSQLNKQPEWLLRCLLSRAKGGHEDQSHRPLLDLHVHPPASKLNFFMEKSSSKSFRTSNNTLFYQHQSTPSIRRPHPSPPLLQALTLVHLHPQSQVSVFVLLPSPRIWHNILLRCCVACSVNPRRRYGQPRIRTRLNSSDNKSF